MSKKETTKFLVQIIVSIGSAILTALGAVHRPLRSIPGIASGGSTSASATTT